MFSIGFSLSLNNVLGAKLCQQNGYDKGKFCVEKTQTIARGFLAKQIHKL